MPSSTDTSWPSSALARIGRISRETQSSDARRFLDETALVDQGRDARPKALVQELGARRELRIDREALAQDEALALGRAPELGDQRPRFLGVDVVEREGRDPAPVVESGRQQARIGARRKIRRRLDVHVRPEDEPRHGEGPEQVVEGWLGRVPHRDPRLGAEVLDDDLLDVPVPLVEVADRDERVHALPGRLADADEQARRERDAELPGERDRPDPPRGHLVRRTVVGHTALEEPVRESLEHQPHAHVDLTQRGQVTLGHDAGVRVRQQGRFLQNGLAHGVQVRQRRTVAVPSEELAMRREQRLRFVAEREEGFFGAEPAARLGERHDLVRRHRVGARLARVAAERAVAAVVAAEGRQGHEDLGGEGDGAATSAVAKLARSGE